MWHRLDRILDGWSRRGEKAAARCDACGGPLRPDPALVVEVLPAGERRRVCSPECLPAVWKDFEVRRQKLSGGRFPAVQRSVTGLGFHMKGD